MPPTEQVTLNLKCSVWALPPLWSPSSSCCPSPRMVGPYVCIPSPQLCIQQALSRGEPAESAMFLPGPGQGHLLSRAATAWGGTAILPPLFLSWRPLSVVFVQTGGANTRAEGGPVQLVDTGAEQLIQCKGLRPAGVWRGLAGVQCHLSPWHPVGQGCML